MSVRSSLITLSAGICLLVTASLATAQNQGSEPPISPDILATYGKVDIPPGYWLKQSDSELRQWLRVAELELNRCKTNATALGKSLAELETVSGVSGDTILELRKLHEKLAKCYRINAAIISAIKKEQNRRISSIVSTPKKEAQPKKAKADRDKRVKALKEQKKLTAKQEKALKAAQAALKESKAILDDIIKKNK